MYAVILYRNNSVIIQSYVYEMYLRKADCTRLMAAVIRANKQQLVKTLSQLSFGSPSNKLSQANGAGLTAVPNNHGVCQKAFLLALLWIFKLGNVIHSEFNTMLKCLCFNTLMKKKKTSAPSSKET